MTTPKKPVAKKPAAKKPAAKKPTAKKLAPKKLAAKKPTAPRTSHEGEPKRHRIFGMSFASVYPHYVNKAERKGRTKAEVDAIIAWLTGYDRAALARVLETRIDFETFFAKATLHPNAKLIQGVVCGVRVQDVEDPLMRQIRYLDKLIDELAAGKKMESILRTG